MWKIITCHCTAFWERKGVSHTDFLPQGSTINLDVYFKMLIQTKRRGMLPQGIMFIHNNAQPYTATATQHFFTTFGWEQLDHPPSIPDLTPSKYHKNLKSFLGGQQFHNDNYDFKQAINKWFKSQLVNFYDEGAQYQVPCYEKWFSNDRNYAQK